MCKSLLPDGGHEVTGIIRNPESEKQRGYASDWFRPQHLALADERRVALLGKMGVKLIKGDLEDVSSNSSALNGMDGACCQCGLSVPSIAFPASPPDALACL